MNSFSTEDYNHFSLIWKPQAEEDQTLFLVRLPIETKKLTWRDYQRLMMLRIQWMIHHWLEESGEDQIQAHRRLSQALRVLSTQEPPTLYEDDQAKELEPLWWWTQEWAETFVERNEALATKFQIINSLIFPTQLALAPSEIQQAWMEEHNEITLENWLSQLTYGMVE